MKTLTLALLFVTTAGLAATSASASLDSKVELRIKAKDLKTENGRAEILRKIKSTARLECSGGLAASWVEKECRTDLEQQFVTAIGNPSLLALYQGQNLKIARNGL